MERIEIARERGRRRRRRGDRDGVQRSRAAPACAASRARFIINIDHHAGNRMYGAINWFDESAAACGEMVFDLIRALGVPLTLEIATHIYLAILTDTGSFHHSNITPRTFDICRQTVEAGVNPAAMARRVFDSNSFGKLKLIGALLDSMELARRRPARRAYMDDGMLDGVRLHAQRHRGLINLPLTAREIQAVVFFKVGARRRRARQHAIEVRRRRARASPTRSAAAATRTPPASPSRARSTECATDPRSWRRHRRGLQSGRLGIDGVGLGLPPVAGVCAADAELGLEPGMRPRLADRELRADHDGVLIVDKPAGPTSHDVVARVRRALGISRIGHTGTLDPLATGVLPLVVGRATRLAQFLTADEKEYVAGVRLGLATDDLRRRRAHRCASAPS